MKHLPKTKRTVYFTQIKRMESIWNFEKERLQVECLLACSPSCLLLTKKFSAWVYWKLFCCFWPIKPHNFAHVVLPTLFFPWIACGYHLVLQKTFLLVGFFNWISCNKGSKAKISCFFVCFFCLTPLRLECSRSRKMASFLTSQRLKKYRNLHPPSCMNGVKTW